MKLRDLLALSLLLVVPTVLSGCQPAGVDTNRSAVTTATPETVDTAAIESELLRIENDWPRVIREKDGAAARRVEADDLYLVYPDGSVGNKEQDVKDVENGMLVADSLEMADLKVHVLDKDVAYASGRIIVTNGKIKLPNGKTMDISGQYRFIDTFARRNGEWKLVAGASVPLRQPVASGSPSPAVSPSVKASPAAAASPTVRTSPARDASPTATP